MYICSFIIWFWIISLFFSLSKLSFLQFWSFFFLYKIILIFFSQRKNNCLLVQVIWITGLYVIHSIILKRIVHNFYILNIFFILRCVRFCSVLLSFVFYSLSSEMLSHVLKHISEFHCRHIDKKKCMKKRTMREILHDYLNIFKT